jgi:hypothetical protein
VEHTVISQFLLRALLVPIVLLWGYHLAQRRFIEQGPRKRSASLQITLLFIGVWIAAYLLRRFRVDDVFLFPVLAAAAIAVVAGRRSMFPYRIRCARCRTPLPLKRILFVDSPGCEACEKEGTR